MNVRAALVALLLPLFSFGRAEACACYAIRGETVASHAAKMYSIFKGEHVGELERPESDSPETGFAKFRMVEVLKGPKSDFIAIRFTRDNGSNCGLPSFEIGSVYEVFAFESQGIIRMTECEGTRKADSVRGRRSWQHYKRVLKK